jgi:DNA polymerase phi
VPLAASNALPLDAATLSLVNDARVVLTPLSRRGLAAAIVASLRAASLTSILSADAPPVAYLLRRLVTGVSASSGGARENMALVLSALSRELRSDANSSGPAAVAAVVAVIGSVYGEKGSFELGYAGAERERAVGALTACSAVVSSLLDQTNGKGSFLMPGAAARDVVVMLRTAALAADGKWMLGLPCVHVVCTLLPLLEPSVFDEFLSKPLLKWCRDRLRRSDGIALALVLCYGPGRNLTRQAFDALYPSSDILHASLLDCFEHGFPLWPREASSDLSPMPLLPLQWSLAVKLAADSSGTQHFGGNLQSFWCDFVTRSLVSESSSIDKKTLAVAILPSIVEACPSLDIFMTLLGDSLSALVSLSGGGRRAGGVNVRRRKHAGEICDRLAKSVSSLGQALASCIRDKQRRGLKDAGVWARVLLVWSLKKRVSTKMFDADSLRSICSLMTAADVDDLFRDVVRMFAQPECKSAGEATLVRASNLRFLASLSTIRPELAADVVKVLALYCIFEPTADVGEDLACHTAGQKRKTENTDFIAIKAMRRHSGSKDNSFPLHFGGLAPRPVPELASASRESAFRYLTDLVATTAGRSVGNAGSSNVALVETALAFIRGLSRCKDERMVNLRQTDDQMQKDAEAAMELLANAPSDVSLHPVVRSMRVMAQYMTLYLYDRSSLQESGNNRVSPYVYARVLSLMGQCLKAVQAEAASATSTTLHESPCGESSSAGEADLEEIREPTALEQMTYIVAIVCRQHSSTLRHIAASAFEKIGDIADSSVTAVIFDLLESDGTGDVGTKHDTEIGGRDGKVVTDERALDSGHDDAEKMDKAGETGEEEDHENRENGYDDEKSDEEVEDDDDGPEAGLSNLDGAMMTVFEDAKRNAYEDGDSDDEMNMMVDDEDPVVLEMYNKHLSQHLKLLKLEKSRSKQARSKSTRKSSSAARLLDLCEMLARRLRLRLEKDDSSSEQGTMLSFLDLVVRVIEFGFGRETDGISHLPRLVSIFSKHLDRPLASFAGKQVPSHEAASLLTRFFEALKSADGHRRAAAAEMRMVAHAGSMMVYAALDSPGHMALASTGYSDLWVQFSSQSNRLIGSTMFSSVVARVPVFADQIVTLAVGTVVNDKSTGGTRSLALQTLYTCVPTVRDLDSTVVSLFWDGVYQCLAETASADRAKLIWKHGAAFVDLLRILDSGLKGGELEGKSDIGSLVQSVLGAIKVPRHVDKKQRKLVNSIFGSCSSSGVSSDFHVASTKIPSSANEKQSTTRNATRKGDDVVSEVDVALEKVMPAQSAAAVAEQAVTTPKRITRSTRKKQKVQQA